MARPKVISRWFTQCNVSGVGAMVQISVPEWEFRVVFGSTKIEFDPDKELANRKNHKYSLESGVQQLERMVFPIGAPPPCITSDGYCENGASPKERETFRLITGYREIGC